MDLNFTMIIKRKEKKIIWLYLNGLKLESDYEEVKISTVHWVSTETYQQRYLPLIFISQTNNQKDEVIS